MRYIISIGVLVSLMIQSVAFGENSDSIIGRPYKSFETTAFCSYTKFHPSQYLTDNNWDILCAFVESGTIEKLDSLGIPYNKSQLRLLEVVDLLTSYQGKYNTVMPIFGKEETQLIRAQSKEFADSIFPKIEPEIRELISEFNKAGYSKQVYSLIFSYLLDHYIWDNDKLPSSDNCENHGTWSGAYWAMFNPRSNIKVGTNSYGPVCFTWTNELGYWLGSRKLISFAQEVIDSNGKRIAKQDVIDNVKDWGLTDENGNILIPVLRVNSKDNIDLLSKNITTQISDAVKDHCKTWSKSHNLSSDSLGQIIFYHEVLWDLLDILESTGLISKPPILKGEEVGKEHFGDISFIFVEEKENPN